MGSGGGFDHLSPDPDLRSLATLSVRVSPSADDNADGIFQRLLSRAFLAHRGSVAYDLGQFHPVELLCGLLLNRSMYTIGCSTVQRYDGLLGLWRLDVHPGSAVLSSRKGGVPLPSAIGTGNASGKYPVIHCTLWPTVPCALIIDIRHHRTYALIVSVPFLSLVSAVGISNIFWFSDPIFALVSPLCDHHVSGICSSDSLLPRPHFRSDSGVKIGFERFQVWTL